MNRCFRNTEVNVELVPGSQTGAAAGAAERSFPFRCGAAAFCWQLDSMHHCRPQKQTCPMKAATAAAGSHSLTDSLCAGQEAAVCPGTVW